MSSGSLTTEQILTLLAAAPTRLMALTSGLEPAQLRSSPAPDEWSANDVLAHLRACADVWGDSIATIITEDRPTIRAVNPRTWITKMDYLDLDFQASLRAFATQRADLLAILEPLPLDGWSRTASVTGAGRPLILTVLSYAQRLAIHERPHLKQIERTVNTMHPLKGDVSLPSPGARRHIPLSRECVARPPSRSRPDRRLGRR